MAEVKIAMISSTIRDLPEHREKVRDGCLRQGYFPSMMENWPAIDTDGINASLAKVDEAEIYIGIFGFRYGYVPSGSQMSVTEMEFNRAVERNIPRLLFLMGEDHLVNVQGVDRGANAERLDKLKAKLKGERCVSFFSSPDELLAKVIDSLSKLKAESAIVAEPLQIAVASYDPRYSIFFVPFRAKGNQVIGRQNALDSVRKQLCLGHRTAIGQTASFVGLGGLGKTQLAVEYAYAFRDQYPNGVIWLSADQNIDRQLVEVGTRAKWFPPESEQKDKLAIARHRLRNSSGALLIFDNLLDVKIVEEYLPEPDAEPHILITSRSEHGSFDPVPLELLTIDQSVELLLQESGRRCDSDSERQAIREIAEKLGGLPLALELAGAYLRHRAIRLEDYRDLLAHNLKAALPAKFLTGSFTRHETDLYSTLRVHSEVFTEDPLLKDILDVLTWSGHGSMGISLLADLLGMAPQDLTNALTLGTTLRLIQKVPGKDTYLIHQLVREVRREDVPIESLGDSVLTVSERLVAWFQRHKRDFADLPKFDAEVEHLKAWLVNMTGRSHRICRRLVWLQAYPPFHRGNYKESLSFLQHASELIDESGETDDELKANLCTDLCTIHGHLGDYAVAKKYGLAGLEIWMRLHGEKHADTAMSLNNLGAACRTTGDPKSGLEYGQRALNVWQELEGERNIDTALALDNLGAAHKLLGNSDLALELAMKACSIREEVLGPLHPDTASSLSHVGKLFLENNKAIEALKYQERALEIAEELFGKCSALRGSVLKNLGMVYHETGNHPRALDYFKEALSIRRELFGDRHPETVISVVDYAFTLCRVRHIHQGHQLIDECLQRLPNGHSQSNWLKEKRRVLQRQFPRPGFRQPRR